MFVPINHLNLKSIKVLSSSKLLPLLNRKNDHCDSIISVLTFQIWIDDAKSSKGFAKAIFTTANYTISALVIVHFRAGVRLLILVMKSIYLTSDTVVFNKFLSYTNGQNYIFSRI